MLSPSVVSGFVESKQSRFNADVLQASSPGTWGLSQPLDYSACPSSTLIETESESEVVSDSLQPCGLCPWDFPGRSTGVGCHFLLQGIFQTQGSNPGLPHCRQTLYHLTTREVYVYYE